MLPVNKLSEFTASPDRQCRKPIYDRTENVGNIFTTGQKMSETYLRQDRQCRKPIYDWIENVGHLFTTVCRK